jgi:hypothetical protein
MLPSGALVASHHLLLTSRGISSRTTSTIVEVIVSVK